LNIDYFDNVFFVEIQKTFEEREAKRILFNTLW